MQPQQSNNPRNNTNSGGSKSAEIVKRAAGDVPASIIGRINAATDQFFDYAHHETDHLGEIATQAIDQGVQYIHRLEKRAQKHPIIAGAIVVGVGLLALRVVLHPFKALARL